MKNQNTLLVVGLLLLVVVVVAFAMMTKKQQVPTPLQNTNQVTPVEKTQVLPTRTPEEIKIIAQIKDYNIDITDKGFSPVSMTIKANDQVFWTNKDTKTHKVAGEGWGNVPINADERFVQAFAKPGTYAYTCALHPEEKGTVIVE